MDDDIIEFVIAQDRKYSMDHLWFQQKDQKLMIGVSEFLRVEIGDVLRVILPQAETEEAADAKTDEKAACSHSGRPMRKAP